MQGGAFLFVARNQMARSSIIPTKKPTRSVLETKSVRVADEDEDDDEPAPTPKKAKAVAKPEPEPKKTKGKSKSKDDDDDVQAILDGLREDGKNEGIAFRLDSDDHGLHIRGVISTRCYGLDKAIGRGGIPLSRLTILHGPEASGKTTICLQTAAQCQAEGGIVLYMDKEYKLDPDYAQSLGVDLNRAIISQPPTLEKAFALMTGAIQRRDAIAKRTGRYIPLLIVLDSMNAAITQAQLEGEFDAKHMAPQARLFSSSLPKLMPLVNGSDTSLLWVSQVRKKMNITYGNDEEVAGGNAPKFYAALVIDVRRIGSFKIGDEPAGNKTRATCKKNQVAPPFKKAEFVIRYGVGVDNEMSIIEAALKSKVMKKKGSWLDFGDVRLGAGINKASEQLRKDKALLTRLIEAIPADVLAGKSESDDDDDDDDDDDESTDD